MKPDFQAFHTIIPPRDILQLGKSHAGMQWSMEKGNRELLNKIGATASYAHTLSPKYVPTPTEWHGKPEEH